MTMTHTASAIADSERTPMSPLRKSALIGGVTLDAILTAIHPDREARFADVIDLLRALERGGSLEVRPRRPLPLIERNPVRFWQAVRAGLALALALSLILH